MQGTNNVAVLDREEEELRQELLNMKLETLEQDIEAHPRVETAEEFLAEIPAEIPALEPTEETVTEPEPSETLVPEPSETLVPEPSETTLIPAVEPEQAPIPPMTREQLETLIASMQSKIESMRGESSKNHRPGKPTNKVYVRIAEMSTSGKVPQQQLDLSKILTAGMVLNQEYSEDQVFKLVTDKAPEYRSLSTSKQDPTYLLRYYRGLKKQGNHAGFIARNFLRVK